MYMILAGWKFHLPMSPLCYICLFPTFSLNKVSPTLFIWSFPMCHPYPSFSSFPYLSLPYLSLLFLPNLSPLFFPLPAVSSLTVFYLLLTVISYPLPICSFSICSVPPLHDLSLYLSSPYLHPLPIRPLYICSSQPVSPPCVHTSTSFVLPYFPCPAYNLPYLCPILAMSPVPSTSVFLIIYLIYFFWFAISWSCFLLPSFHINTWLGEGINQNFLLTRNCNGRWECSGCTETGNWETEVIW